MRTLGLICIILSAPVTMTFLGWGAMRVYDDFGMIPFLIVCASCFLSWLGCASLLAEKEEELKRLQGDQ